MNTLIITGRATKDFEGSLSNKGLQLASGGIAIDQYGDRPTIFMDVTCMGNNADFALKYIKKGDTIGLVGRLDYREFDRKDGTKGKQYSIFASQIEIIKNKYNPDKKYETKTQAQENRAERMEREESKNLPEVDDDNLPF
jgi:single-strand DNA-binding protein